MLVFFFFFTSFLVLSNIFIIIFFFLFFESIRIIYIVYFALSHIYFFHQLKNKKVMNKTLTLSVLWLIVCLKFNLSDACGEPLKRICYFTSWSGILPTDRPELCTHVIYSFASIEAGTLSGVWSNPLKELRQKNSNIKLMVAVGGWALVDFFLLVCILLLFIIIIIII